MDAQGEIWLRAADIKRFLEHNETNAVLAKRYPTPYWQMVSEFYKATGLYCMPDSY